MRPERGVRLMRLRPRPPLLLFFANAGYPFLGCYAYGAYLYTAYGAFHYTAVAAPAVKVGLLYTRVSNKKYGDKI